MNDELEIVYCARRVPSCAEERECVALAWWLSARRVANGELRHAMRRSLILNWISGSGSTAKYILENSIHPMAASRYEDSRQHTAVGFRSSKTDVSVRESRNLNSTLIERRRYASKIVVWLRVATFRVIDVR
jgi:hypothetical protein